MGEPLDHKKPLTLALRAEEAAAALSISRRFLHTLTKRGEIRAVKVGRAILYPRANLERWLAERSAPTSEGGVGGC